MNHGEQEQPELESEPLLGCGDGAHDPSIVYDEEGSLTMALAALGTTPADAPRNPCPPPTRRQLVHPHRSARSAQGHSGAVRIEVAAPKIRIVWR